MPARAVYLTGLESGGGKSAVALGVAEPLSRGATVKYVVGTVAITAIQAAR